MDSDPIVHKYIMNKPLIHIGESRAYIENVMEQYRRNGIGRYAVVLKETSEFIGWAGLKIETNVNGREKFFDLGYRFIPRFWNKGYATEASSAILYYGFKILLNVDVICAYASTGAAASCRVLEKLGFQKKNIFFDDTDECILV